MGRKPLHNDAPSGMPTKPDGLDSIASEAWDDIVPKLFEQGRATSVDALQLQGLCEWWSEYRKACDTQCDAYRRAVLKAVAWKQFSAIATKFGMSPKDRQRMPKVDVVNPDDPIARLIRERGHRQAG